MKMQITNHRRASHVAARIYLVFRDRDCSAGFLLMLRESALSEFLGKG
jgi:hypothetical protein